MGVSLDAPINDVEGATVADTIASASGSTPEDIAAAREQLGRIRMKNDTEADAVALRAQGYSFEAIGERVGRSGVGAGLIVQRVVSRGR